MPEKMVKVPLRLLQSAYQHGVAGRGLEAWRDLQALYKASLERPPPDPPPPPAPPLCPECGQRPVGFSDYRGERTMHWACGECVSRWMADERATMAALHARHPAVDVRVINMLVRHFFPARGPRPSDDMATWVEDRIRAASNVELRASVRYFGTRSIEITRAVWPYTGAADA